MMFISISALKLIIRRANQFLGDEISRKLVPHVKFLRSEFIDAHQRRNQVYSAKYTPVITTEFEYLIWRSCLHDHPLKLWKS